MLNQTNAIPSAVATSQAKTHKRKKTVFDTGEIPHLWAHKVQVSARNPQGNLYFDSEDVQRAQALIAECRAFCKFFGLKIPKFAKPPKIDAEKLKRQKDAQQAREDKRIADRRAESERWQAQHRREVEAWLNSGICQHNPLHEFHEQYRCEEMRKDEAWREKSAEIIEAWRQGDVNAHLRNAWNLPVMLRVRTFGADESVAGEVGRVETSRGAQVPISHALRGLRFVRSVVARGEEFVTNGHTFHLGHYKIDRIEVDGTLHAGCHVISLAEIKRIAPVLESLNVEGVQS
jgi:hypothetical protein